MGISKSVPDFRQNEGATSLKKVQHHSKKFDPAWSKIIQIVVILSNVNQFEPI